MHLCRLGYNRKEKFCFRLAADAAKRKHRTRVLVAADFFRPNRLCLTTSETTAANLSSGRVFGESAGMAAKRYAQTVIDIAVELGLTGVSVVGVSPPLRSLGRESGRD